jgi:dihydroorotase
MKPTVFRRGQLIDPRNGVDGVRDLLLQDGKVAAVSEAPLSVPDAEVVDATGLWVVPGFVDLHVHLREPGDEGKETILTGAQAAVAGGFTSIVAMPNTRPVNDSPLVTQAVLARAREANLCQIYPAGAISKGLSGEELAELGELKGAGCVCFTDDGRPVMSAGLMRRVLQYAQAFGLPVMVHEEDLTLVGAPAAGGTGGLTEGPTATRLGLHPVPRSAEVVMVARDLVLLEETGGRLHIAHVSCAGSVALLREAKRQGLKVTAEAAPHHFTLTDAAVARYNTHAKMNPPLRQESDVRALREALADGTIDAIATDHAPHGARDKDVPYADAANGVVGLETALALTLALVRDGVLTPSRAIQLLSDAPARCFGLPHGHLGVGAPGDVTVVDPTVSWTVDAQRFWSKSRNTPFHGQRVQGRVLFTYVAGRQVYALKGAP